MQIPPKAPTRVYVGVICTLALVILIGGYLTMRPWKPNSQTAIFRVGFQSSAPSVIVRDGKPEGVVIDILKEACRRRRIPIQWVLLPEGPDVALRSGHADLWPQVGDLPERHKYLYISKAWEANSLWAIARQNSGVSSANLAAVETVVYQPSPLIEKLAARYFPAAQKLARSTPASLISAICSGEAKAGILSSGKLVMQAVEKAGQCGNEIDFIPLPMAMMTWGVGATLERSDARHAADAIRDEIGAMARDGTLSTISIRSSHDPLEELSLIAQLDEASKRSRWMLAGIGAMGAMLLLIGLQSRRLQKARRGADAASRSKSEFLANMSHEIRTPMNGVMGITGLLLDTDLTSQQRAYGEMLYASGESLLRLINDVLDFSKIEAQKLDLETIDFDLEVLLDDFASTLALRAHDKGLELLCSANPAVPRLLRGDPGRLRQILTNLTGNAIKFTAKGEVVISASVVERGATDILLRFSVRDTGIGIPAEKVQMVFEKFTQVDASTTRKYGGTGLGLAISKQLAELMGGRMGLESTEGKGSEFWFTVRLGRQSEVPADQSAGSELNLVRILIADDSETSRDMLAARLAHLGMRPQCVDNGSAALLALGKAIDENDPFRLALIDRHMPELDGESLGRLIAGDARFSSTRLLLMSTLGEKEGDRTLGVVGFAATTPKPIRHHDLKPLLSSLLRQQQSALEVAVGALRVEPTQRKDADLRGLFANRPARVLVADDNITNQQVALGILKKLGISDAQVAGDGREVLHAISTSQFDLVFMDVSMPHMDGLEASRRIRQTEKEAVDTAGSRHLPIVAMTAGAMSQDKEACLAAGMDDYVSKPVNPRAMAQALQRWLPQESETSQELTPDARKPPSTAMH